MKAADDRRDQTMRVLDLDLDFFLSDVAYFAGPDERLFPEDYVPLDEAAVRAFLEERCGLDRVRPVPGRVVRHHHEAFLFWRDLVRSGALATPFDLVHIDAHADLGTGDAGYVYLMTDVLHRPVEKRADVEIGYTQLNAGNYVAFAAACRWLRSVVYVPNPKSRDDLMYLHFQNLKASSGFLQLKACDPKGLDAILGRDDLSVPLALEPAIPFAKVAAKDYRDTEGFSFVVLCHSPGFTPPTADRLIPVI